MPIAFPDWNDLRDILLITDAGTLSAAARAAGVSQSTMSRRLSAIEAGGQPLFTRGETGRMLPNDRGAALVAAAREMAAIYDKVRAEMTGAPPPLRVVACEVSERLFLSQALPIWSARADSPAQLSVRPDPQSAPPGSYDVLVATMAAVPEHSAGQLLGRLEWGWFAAPSYVAQHRVRGRIDSLADHFVLAASGPLASMEAYRWLAAQGSTVTMFAPSLAEMIGGCAKGMGLAMLPVTLAEADPRLLRLQGPVAPPSEVWMIAEAQAAREPRIAGFLRWARSHFRA
ncbi:MAG: hypothetical protein RIT14_427 [Pseudomonadota bacterium]